MPNFISDEQVEAALDFIRDSAGDYGRLRGYTKYLDHKRKIVRGQAFLESKEKTAAAKNAYAESCPEYREVVEEIKEMETELGTMLTLIKAAEFKIETWRSLNARSNRGHL